MKRVAVFLFSIYGLLVFVSIMVILFPFVLFFAIWGPVGVRLAFRIIELWCWLFSLFTFIRIRISRSKKIAKGVSYMYVSNHTSFLDAIALPLAIPGAVRPLGKKELKKMPILGAVIARFAVFVDRKDRQSRKKSIEMMLEVSKYGDALLIFPEGTMNRTENRLQPFFEGAYRIAREADIDVVPVVVHGAGKLLPPGRFSLQPGVINVELGDPIEDKNLTVSELKVLTYEWIDSKLKENE